MRKSKNTLLKTICCFLLLLGLSVWESGYAAQAEQAFTIYESELETLEMNSQMLKDSSRKKDELLQKQEKQLKEAENELQIANKRIDSLEKSNEATENSLKKIRESFNAYEKEAEKKIKVAKRQKNTWIIMTALAVGWAVSRR
nr:MAG TPA: Peptidoglycan endopeptidase [Caudoviricetes sp.]